MIERSPNANAGVKPAPTAALPSPQPQPATPTPPVPAGPPVGTSPQKNEKPTGSIVEQHAAAADEPTTKAYREGDWRPEYHVVRKGDTLYSIALDYGQDYRELAAWNNLEDPAKIRIDQRLRLFAPDSAGVSTNPQPVVLPAPQAVVIPAFSEPKARKLPYSEQALAQLKSVTLKPDLPVKPTSPSATVTAKSPPVPSTVASPPAPAQVDLAPSDSKMLWEWPAQGKLLYAFGQGPIKKGVGIEGRTGQPVMAAAPGKVVYSGSGLRGYGKLIIVKHNESYLSVYAHNSQILVKEGQTVAKGQKIAEIGSTDSDHIALHFEIRRLGKPIDPLQYLPERAS